MFLYLEKEKRFMMKQFGDGIKVILSEYLGSVIQCNVSKKVFQTNPVILILYYKRCIQTKKKAN